MEATWLIGVSDQSWLERVAAVLLPTYRVCLLGDPWLATHPAGVALVLLGVGAVRPAWCQSESFGGLVAALEGDMDVPLALSISDEALAQLIETACKVAGNRARLMMLEEELRGQMQSLREITQIGISLSSEKELPRLLDEILKEARKLADCEAGSLFLVRKDGPVPMLQFKLFHNERLPLQLPERTFRIDKQSIAGYAALTGQIVNVGDVYALPGSLPYHFDPSFDRTYGYQTRELLTIPMRNHQDEVIGIVQCLNVKAVHRQGQPFDTDTCEMLQALASQAAVAIENSLLLDNIRNLFEGFVAASVMAIEARDPVTSGHSFRVADYTCQLADLLARSPIARLHDAELNRAQWRELRYAALLHDFGKVGVREHVLNKSKKLSHERMDCIRLRILWLKERVMREFAEQHPHCPHCGHAPGTLLVEQCRAQLMELDTYLALLEQANEPAMLHRDDADRLAQIRTFQLPVTFWAHEGLLSDDEYTALSVTRGSLTLDERHEIESHVSHTYTFLATIPWTGDLAQIPMIAGSHHEKLDGSGYPRGLKSDEIPIQTRMMTIADIFDALTARDRPYKAAMPIDRALDVLNMEVRDGKLDSDLVNLFIEARVYEGAMSAVEQVA